MNKLTKVLLTLSFTFTLFAFLLIATNRPPEQAMASVMQGGEYHATTTSPSVLIPTVMPLVILANSGTLGSVVITGSGTGAFQLIDATTSDITKRTGNIATSSLVLASFPNSPTVGTYTFDIAFYKGLLFDTNGTQSTTTITYRSNQ